MNSKINSRINSKKSRKKTDVQVRISNAFSIEIGIGDGD